MKTRTFFMLAAIALIMASSCTKKTYKAKLNNELDSISYSVGVTFGTSLKTNELDNLNIDAIAAALYDIFNEKEEKITLMEAQELLNNYFLMKEFGDVKKEGEDFLKENKTKEGVVTLPSGLQYKVIQTGTGALPKFSDVVLAHYHGTLINGTVFDSSVERGEPLEINVNGVIKGWQEALQLMPVGSKWILYVPQELAYGNVYRQGSPILPYSALIFEVEVLDIIEQ